MKKRIPAIVLLAVILITVFASVQTAAADDRYYIIRKYNVNVAVNTDGSADVEERITYDFFGNFNGVLRNIDYGQTDGIDNLRVLVSDETGNTSELSVNSASDLDAEGPSGTYNVYLSNDIAYLKVYEKSSNEVKVFIYRYRLRNVVTKYNDIAEFNRKIIDSGWDTDLNNITVHITLPEGASQDEIRVFGHGPLTGMSSIIDGQNVEFILGQLSPGDYLESLVLFPVYLVPDSTRVKDENALQRILDNEKKLADEANKQRERARRQVEEQEKRREIRRVFSLVLSIVLCIAWFPIIIYIYIRYDREFKSSFKTKYYRELPGEYTPAEMSVLMNMGQVLPRDITATLMDLVRKGYLLLKEETYRKSGLFKDKAVEDYSLTLQHNAPLSELRRHESFLISWFIDTIGNGEKVFLDEIENYAKSSSGADKFSRDYDKWCKLVKTEAEKNEFFDQSSKKGQVAAILIGISYFFTGFVVISGFGSASGMFVILLGIIAFIFAVRLNRRSAYGNEQYMMWKAFKNFLKDFSRMDKAEMPSIVIWEHYLVYAISLGVAKEVIRQLPIVFSDADLQNSNLTYMYGYNMHNMHSLTHAFDRTFNTIDHAISNAVSVANSQNSSSSGAGGGFSGGSSGGGGGHGGGGAF